MAEESNTNYVGPRVVSGLLPHLHRFLYGNKLRGSGIQGSVANLFLLVAAKLVRNTCQN